MEYRGNRSEKVVAPATFRTSMKRKYRIVPYEELNGTEKILRTIFNGIIYFVQKFTKYITYSLTYFLPPVYYVFFMFVIRRPLVAGSGLVRDLIEISITLFGLININGNFLMQSYSDVSLKTVAKKGMQCCNKSCGDGSEPKVNYCDKCNLYQVENSWHCKVCNQCVVGRDYHCFVFNQCITRHNKRYHILGLFYTLCALVFVSIYALFYTCQGDELNTIYHVPVVGKFLSDLLWGLRFRFANVLDIYGCWLTNLILLINIPLFALTSFMLLNNVNYVVRGTTYWESKKGVNNPWNWKDHVFEIRRFWLPLAAEVFGERWYLAIVLPFVSSPVPNSKRI